MLPAPADIRQLDTWSCGPCCVEAITGTRPSLGSPGFGTSIWGMIDTFRGLGYAVTHGTHWDLDDLKHQIACGRYVVVLINSSGFSHWVVAYKVARGRVYLHDPERGLRIVPWCTFTQLWSCDGYSSLGIAVAKVSAG